MRLIFSLSLLASCIAISSCSTTNPTPESQSANAVNTQAKHSAFEMNIDRALYEISQHQPENAKTILDQLQQTSPSGCPFILLSFAQGKYFQVKGGNSQALATVMNDKVNQVLPSCEPTNQLPIRGLRADLLEQQNLLIESINERIVISQIDNDNTHAEKHAQSIWTGLKKMPVNQLMDTSTTTHDITLQSWLALALVTNTNSMSLEKKLEMLNQWQVANPNHQGNLILGPELASIQQAIAKQGESIAVLIPLQGKYASFGEAIRDGLIQSYFTSNHQPQMRFYNVDENSNFPDIYNAAINDGAKVIIGPLFKNQVELLYRQPSLPVKTIALNKISNSNKPNNLIEYSLAPEDEINSLITLTKNQHKNIFILNQPDEASQKNSRAFTAQWLQTNGKVISSYTAGQVTEIASGIEQPLNIDKSKLRIEQINTALGSRVESNPKARSDIDAILIFTNTDIAKESNLLFQYYFPKSVKKYGSSSLYRGYPDAKNDQDLNNITITDIPLVLNTGADIPPKYRQSSLVRLYALGADAFTINTKTPATNENNYFEGISGHIDFNGNIITRTTPYAIFENGALHAVTTNGDQD